MKEHRMIVVRRGESTHRRRSGRSPEHPLAPRTIMNRAAHQCGACSLLSPDFTVHATDFQIMLASTAIHRPLSVGGGRHPRRR